MSASHWFSKNYLEARKRFISSINELETHLILSARVNLCNFNDIESIIDELNQESKMIISLIKKLKS